jgi:hypothetical protein
VGTQDHADANMHLVFITNGYKKYRVASPQDELKKIFYLSKKYPEYRKKIKRYIDGETEDSRESISGLIGNII